MTVVASRDFRTILRFAKLARLLHAVRRIDVERWEIRFDGPASVLRQTRRYGVSLARFFPCLLICRDWRMIAGIELGRRRMTRLELSSEDRLQGHRPRPDEFDSDLEEAFAAKWGPEPREGWTLIREGAILERGQHAFIPDFELRHESGRRVLLEIVGFWTPEYLEAKRATLARFHDEPIVVAVADAIGDSIPIAGAIGFKSALKLAPVLERLREIASS